MTHKPRFAIIGCGKISPRHAAEASKHGYLAAVCDIIPERAKDLASTHGAAWYDSIESLLTTEKDIDIVSICTPNGLHAAHSIAALQARCHVLCEKPMSIHSHDAKAMMEAAK